MPNTWSLKLNFKCLQQIQESGACIAHYPILHDPRWPKKRFSGTNSFRCKGFFRASLQDAEPGGFFTSTFLNVNSPPGIPGSHWSPRVVYLSLLCSKRNFFQCHSQDCLYFTHTHTKTLPADFTEKLQVTLQCSKKIAKTQLNPSILIDYQPFLPLRVKFTITIAPPLPRSGFKRKKALTMLLLASGISNLSQTEELC